MRAAIVTTLLLAGCAAEAPGVGAALESADAPPGSDAPPAVEIAVRGDESARRGIASVRLADRAVLVGHDRRLLMFDADGTERVLDDEISGVPVADGNGERLVWSAPRGDLSYDVVLLEREEREPRVIARASAPMTPIAWIGETIVFVGSENGGVAGMWLGAPREGALACVTNCALRAGRPWGDGYVPPPGDGASMRIEGGRVSYVAADGSERAATLDRSAP